MAKGRPDLRGRRRTAHFWPDRLKLAEGFFVQMFLEDVRNMVMPIGGRAYGRAEFRVGCHPDDKNTVGRVRVALGARSYRDLTQEICEFIGECAQYVATFGEEFFEIVNLDAGAIAIVSLPPGSAIALGPLTVQIVPSTVAKTPRDRLVLLDPSRAWHLTLPHELGGRWKHTRMLASLGLRATYPQWALSADRAGRPTEIDRDLFVQLVDARILARTKTWGWPARDTGSAHMTSYQRIRRDLVFRRTLAVLREHILGELNAVFARTGVKAVLSFEGLPSAEDCRAAVEDLERGGKPFSEILQTVRW